MYSDEMIAQCTHYYYIVNGIFVGDDVAMKNVTFVKTNFYYVV